MDDTNPTARALRCLELLQDHPGISAERLGQRLGVSDRAARRYVAVLREAGLPVESTRGPYGGYRLGRGHRLPPLLFRADEALALVMAVLDGHHDAADADDPVGRGIGKLVRALPEGVAAQAELVRRTAAATPDRAAARPDPGTLTSLVEACSARRRVRLGYRSEAGNELDVEVDPWAVVVRHGRWYLLCWSHGAADRRTYRVDRVTSLATLDATFEPPDDLDPVGDLESAMAVGWEYAVEVVVDAPPDRVARWFGPSLGRAEPTDDGRTRITSTTGNPHFYVEALVRLPVAFHVVGGEELRAAARVVGNRLLAAADG